MNRSEYADNLRKTAAEMRAAAAQRASSMICAAGTLTVGPPRTETATVVDVFLDGEKVAEIEQEGPDGLFEVEMAGEDAFDSLESALAEIADCCCSDDSVDMGEPTMGSPMQMAARRLKARAGLRMVQLTPIKTVDDLRKAIAMIDGTVLTDDMIDREIAKAQINAAATALRRPDLIPHVWKTLPTNK